MFEGVKAFQKREGLPVDGIARPGGTTEQMLNVALSERATQKSAAEREASRQAHRRDAARAPSLASPARRAGARRAGGRADDTAGTGSRGTGTRGIGLRGTVGPRGTNAGADLATTRRALERAGLLDAHDVGRGPQAARPDEGFLDAVIRNVQRRHGLAQDGTITPGGPTDRRLARIVDADRIMHTVPRLDTEEDAGAPGAGDDAGEPGEAVFGNTHDRTVRTARPAFGNTANAEQIASVPSKDAFLLLDTGHRPITGGLFTRPPDVNGSTVGQQRERHPHDAPDPNAAPLLTKFSDRVRSIVDDTPARFEVHDNPEADPSSRWYESHSAGKVAVLTYGRILEEEAKRQGVDINLVKAIVYAENARGHYQGLSKVAEAVGLAETYFPMNINVNVWQGLGIDENTVLVPRENVRAGVTLLRRLAARVIDPSPEKIATLWNNTASDSLTNYGVYVARIYRERPWEN